MYLLEYEKIGPGILQRCENRIEEDVVANAKIRKLR